MALESKPLQLPPRFLFIPPFILTENNIATGQKISLTSNLSSSITDQVIRVSYWLERGNGYYLCDQT